MVGEGSAPVVVERCLGVLWHAQVMPVLLPTSAHLGTLKQRTESERVSDGCTVFS